MPETVDFRDRFALPFELSIYYKGVEYNPQIVQYMNIREWVTEVLPRLELLIVDDGTFTEIFPIEDNDEFQIVLAPNKDDDESRQLDVTFNLLDYKISPYQDTGTFYVEISGLLKNNDIFLSKNRSFNNLNSVTVLKDIANEEGIEFKNPWNVNSSDNMTWYQYNLNNHDFIKHVLKRSYLLEDLPFFYANTQGDFVYTSLLAEAYKSDEKIAKFNLEKSTKFEVADEDKDIIWYSQYDIVNMNGFNNKKMSYGATYTYYDLAEPVTDSIFYDNIYGEVSFRDASKVGSNTNVNPSYSPVYGHLNNVYDEYFRTMVNNELLKKQFFSFSMALSVNGICDVKLFDKINLLIPAKFGSGGKSLEHNDVNEVMSGNYLVGGITHRISRSSPYSKIVVLFRDGMNKSPYVNNWNNEV